MKWTYSCPSIFGSLFEASTFAIITTKSKEMTKSTNTKPQSKRQEATSGRVKRIIDIYAQLNNGVKIVVSDYCNDNHITERTFRRDIQLLKEVVEGFEIANSWIIDDSCQKLCYEWDYLQVRKDSSK